MRHIFLSFSVLVVICFQYLTTPVKAEILQDQVVTYADFSHVRYIASSLKYVYFATTRGIIRYNKLQEQWDEPLTGTSGIDEDDIQRIWVDNFDNNLYAETSAGLFEYDLLFGRWYPISELPELNNASKHVKPPEIMYPPPGFNYDGGGRLIDYWGRYYSFRDVLDDGAGQLWIGTWGYGAGKAGSATDFIELLPYGLLQDRVNTIFDDDTVLWVSGAVYGSYRTGLTIFNPEKETFSYIESGVGNSFPSVDVNCLTGDDKSIYIGTPYGLYILDKKTKSVEQKISRRHGLPDDNIISLLVDGDSIFVGTASGLGFLTIKADSVRVLRPQQFSGAIIYDLEQVNSSVWIASSAGAFRLKYGSGKLQRFQDPDLVLFGDVYDIEQYAEDLWFLSTGGLVRLNMATGTSRQYRDVTRAIEPHALAVNDTIAAVASNKGLTILFYGNKKPFTRDFTTDDGLPSNYLYTLLFDGDYLWIGSDRGLTRFLWNNPRRVD